MRLKYAESLLYTTRNRLIRRKQSRIGVAITKLAQCWIAYQLKTIREWHCDNRNKAMFIGVMTLYQYIAVSYSYDYDNIVWTHARIGHNWKILEIFGNLFLGTSFLEC